MQGKIGENCFWQNKLFTMQIYGIILMMLGSKGILPPTDIHELLRCYATFAILKTFGFADFP